MYKALANNADTHKLTELANKELQGGTTTVVVDRDDTHCSTWLEDYLERLVGKDEYRKFQEHHDNAHEYYVLMASLLA